MGMTQGEAVFQGVSQVFDTDVKVPETGAWTDEQKTKVYAAVFSFFKSGQCTHKANPDDEALAKYIPGLVNNWVRKDKRLNGNTTYQAKRPGSRTGSGDETLKNLKILHSVQTDPAVKAKIEDAIEKRLAEMKPKTEINVGALPEHLRQYVQQ